MAAYKVYTLDKVGHISGPPAILNCGDDDSAVETAKQYRDGKALEVWELKRLVARLAPIHE